MQPDNQMALVWARKAGKKGGYMFVVMSVYYVHTGISAGYVNRWNMHLLQPLSGHYGAV